MPPQDLLLHLLQNILPHILLKLGVLPTSVHNLLCVSVPLSVEPPYYGNLPGPVPCRGSPSTSPTQREEPPVSPPWNISPTPECLRLPVPISSPSKPTLSVPSEVFPPPWASNRSMLREFSQGTWNIALRWVDGHTPGNTIQYLPASPPWPTYAASVLPPFFIGKCWSVGRLRPPTAPTYCSGDTVGKGVPPPPTFIKVSHKCRCRKCMQSPVLVVTLPWHTSTSQSRDPDALGN